MSLPLGGFLPQSLVDFPGHVSAVLYTSGCNFRCPFCHNPELVLPSQFGAPPLLDIEDVIGRLRRNRGLLGGVTITGGEPTIHPALPDALRALRELGFSIKLDTNGSVPGMLHELLKEGLVDMVAMDIKAPLEVGPYSRLSGICCSPDLLQRLGESIRLLIASGVDCRFRSTIVEGLHTEGEVLALREMLGGRILFQPFRPGKTLAMNAH